MYVSRQPGGLDTLSRVMPVEVEEWARNLLGRTDSKTFWSQKKCPKKGEDIEGGWPGKQRREKVIWKRTVLSKGRLEAL